MIILSYSEMNTVWPPQYLGTVHEEIQRKATEIISTRYIPNIRTGGKAKKRRVNFVDKMDDDNVFKPTPSKSKKQPAKKEPSLNDWYKAKRDEKGETARNEAKPNESFNASFETWDSRRDQSRNNERSTYMKGRILDYPSIEASGELRTGKVIVTGPGAATGKIPQEIPVTEEMLDNIRKANVYIDTEIIDAALSLIDRKLSQDANYVEGVQVYDNTTLRLIQAGSTDLVKEGEFIAIFPRKFPREEEEEHGQALARGEARLDLNIGHYTLVSDIHCSKDEVNVYETLQAYRKKSNILTNDQKKLLKKLKKCEDRPLRVHCVNVVPQREAECGAISVALAAKLCFSTEDEKDVFEKFIDVRRDLALSLRENELMAFESKASNFIGSKEILFSIKI